MCLPGLVKTATVENNEYEIEKGGAYFVQYYTLHTLSNTSHIHFFSVSVYPTGMWQKNTRRRPSLTLFVSPAKRHEA